jgi:hypothetical protein
MRVRRTVLIKLWKNSHNFIDAEYVCGVNSYLK